VRFLTPTENRRLNELIGFLGITLALLAALSLLSYSPRDASLNVSAPPPEARPARNWIGPVGAHGADILFQGFGYAAFLFPVGLCLLGLRWFRSQEVPSPVAKVIGYALLLLTRLSFALLVGTYVGIRLQTSAEEAYLLRTYEDAYRAYARRVGRFVPRLGRLTCALDKPGPEFPELSTRQGAPAP